MRISRGAVPNSAAARTSIGARAIRVVVVFLAFTGAALATSTLPLEGTGLSSPSLVGISAFTVAGLLLALIALGGVRLQRALRSRVSARKALAGIEGIDACGSSGTVAKEFQNERSDTDPTEQPDVRVLRLLVRSLETALEEQQSLGVAQSGRDIEHERAQARADESQRILLTIQGMREATASDPEAEHVLNRIEAALTRLSTPSSAGRPVLPDRVPEQPDQRAAPPSPLIPGPAPVLPIDDTTVLPVPAPEPQAIRGSGRRFRHNNGTGRAERPLAFRERNDRRSSGF